MAKDVQDSLATAGRFLVRSRGRDMFDSLERLLTEGDESYQDDEELGDEEFEDDEDLDDEDDEDDPDEEDEDLDEEDEEPRPRSRRRAASRRRS